MIDEIEIVDLDKISLFITNYNTSSIGLADFDELLNIAINRNDNLVLLSLKKYNKIIAFSLFQVTERQVYFLNYKCLHLYGFDFYDYNTFNCESSYESHFIDFIRRYAKRNSIQIILLENIANKLGYLYNTEKIKLFNARKSINGYNDIVEKKRLITYKTKLKEMFSYKVTHYRGDDITDKLINSLANLHIERWLFDNIESPFKNSSRKNDYLLKTDNKVLTIISIDNSILAAHYGILYDNCLLFHTPVINIEYYHHSPYINFIDILILETAIFCAENKIDILDFGLGDEKYKNKYTNSFKEIFTYYMPIGLASYIKLNVFVFLKRLEVKIFINTLRKLYYRFRLLNNKINVYKFPLKIRNKKTSRNFLLISYYSDFVSLFRKINMPVKRFHYVRFKKGDLFYCLLENNQIYCSGWSTSQELYVSEINKTIKISDGTILYDYYTPERFRRQGKYQELLESIIMDVNEDIFIYTLSNNIPSNIAIQRVGFKKFKDYKLK